MLMSRKVFDTCKCIAGYSSKKASNDTHYLKLKACYKMLWGGQKFLTISVDKVHDILRQVEES
jgi:hypothetical protein